MGTSGTASAVGGASPAGGDGVDAAELTEKQRRIVGYLRDHASTEGPVYLKSRGVAADLDMTAKEVGANMRTVLAADLDLTVEKWGYSSGTTWMVTTGR
jgi:hypothetical protein